MAEPVPCAGAIVFDPVGRLLVIRRGREPAAGTWSLPGGRCRASETAAEACVREVQEETGLEVRVLRWVGRVQRDGAGDTVYGIDDFECEVLSGRLRAGDDAVAAGWVTRAEFEALPLAPLLLETLRSWDCLPRS